VLCCGVTGVHEWGMNSSEVLRFLGRKSNKFKQWSLRAKLFKYTNAEKLPDTSSREYNLYQQTVNKLSNKSYHFNGFYSFSPTRQTLTAGVIINASRHGLVIDVANTNTLKLIRDVEYCLLPSDSDVVYVKQDFESMKPHQLWHGKMEDDDGNDQLVFQNNSKSHQMNVTLSRDFRFIFITLLSRLHSEVYVLPSDMSQLPLLVAPPQKMIFYFMEHAHGRFYILTNCGENGGYKVKYTVIWFLRIFLFHL
jgi:protease II